MAVEFGSNFITGITTATSDTDVVYKEYVDNRPGYALTSTAVTGEYYKGDVDTVTTTVGFSSSFVYDTAGSYNYPIDSSASSLNLFITGSGGGGSESTSDGNKSNIGFDWSSVCFCGSEWSYACRKFASNETIIMDASMSNKQVTTSVDGGLSWTRRTIPTPYANCSLTHANNLFVYASCYNGELITSTDAIHWTMRTASVYCSTSSAKFYGVAYGNGLWYASSSCCNSVASTDAIHWTLRTVPRANCQGCSNIVSYGNGVWLDFAYDAPRTSTDTIHWTLRTTVNNNIYAFNTRFICGEFFALTRDTSYTNPLQKSTDAIHWQGAGNLVADRTKLTGSYKFVTDIAKIGFGKKYLVVGDCSELSTSTDFLNWESCKIVDNNKWRSTVCGYNYCWYHIHQSNLTDYPNRYFISGYGYNSTSISDIIVTGASGSGGAASASYMYDISLENVSKKEGLTLCIGSGGNGGGKSWNVSNCSNWTVRTAVPNNCHVFDMTHNQGKFVAVGCGKLLTTSTDAIHWFRRTIGDVQSATNLDSVIYDYNNWLVTGGGTSNLSYGSLSASTDSIHWTQRTTGMTDDHSSIIYNDKKGTYLLNSRGCSIASSTDSIHWKQRTIGSTDSKIAEFIGYGLDYYIAGGGQYFSASTDAIHWKQRTVGNGGGSTPSNFAFAYLHPNYVLSLGVFGNERLISASTDTIHWTNRTGNSGMDILTGQKTKMNSINGEIYRHNSVNCATYSTTDTIHWVCKPFPTGGGFGFNFPAFSYGGGQFVRSYSGNSSTGVCMSSFDASSSGGCDTTISWYDGFPANAKGCVYPLDIASGGGSSPQWDIIMASNCKLSAHSNCIFGCPGTSNWSTITESGTGANTRTGVGDGEGLYSGFFNTTNITKIALVHQHDNSASITPGSGGAWTRYVVYDLVENTGSETLYEILKRLDTYNKNNSSWTGNSGDGCFNANSAKCFVSGNYTSGCLVQDSGHFKVSNCTTCAPDKFAIWGVNEDSDNDTQVLAAYWGCLSTSSGKGDSWRGQNPYQTFFSYWGNDWHSNSCSQTISSGVQTYTGVVPASISGSSGIDCSSIIYMMAYSGGTGGTPPTASSASYCFNPVGSGAAVLEYNSSDFRLSSSNTTAVGDFTVEFWYRLKSDASNPTLQTLFALGEPTENGFLSVKHDATNSALCYYYKNTAGALQSQALATSACDTWYHVALGYDASSTTFSHFLDGTRMGQYNASSAVPAVYGDRLRIGSLYDTYYSLTSLIDQGAFNGEITNFRISNNERYTSGTYTVPTPDFTLDSNTVFLTGRGESFNGSSGSQTCINIPGAAGATTSGPGLSSKYSSELNQSQYSNIISGLNGKRLGCIPTGQNGECDYRNGLKVFVSNSCACCSFSSSGGGVGGLANSGNQQGGVSNKTKFGAFCGKNCESNCSTGVGRGGFGGDAFVNPSLLSFTSRTAGTSSCYIRGAAFLNGYYMANNFASTDTITWELRTVPGPWTNYNYGGYMMAYDETNPTEVIMYTGCCQLYHTTDSIHWKMRTTPFGVNGPSDSCYVNDVNYMNNGEWAVSGCKLISISTDTIHWFLRTAGGCSGGSPLIKGVVYGNNKYMAAGHCCAYIATSTDSIAWTLRTRASSNFNSDSTPYTPAFGNGMFVVTAYESISYSTDAISWTGKNVSGTHYIYGMRFSKRKNQFFSAAYYDKIPMSSDGENWTTFSVAGGSCGQGYAAIPIHDKMLYSNSCSNYLGNLMIADFQEGSSPGKTGNTGAGGGGASYIAPLRETQIGGDGGDGYVRINWK